MAMAIGGERRPAWVQARHWQRLCESVGLNATQPRRRALDLCARALAKKIILSRSCEYRRVGAPPFQRDGAQQYTHRHQARGGGMNRAVE
jgi:hypothetical protein